MAASSRRDRQDDEEIPLLWQDALLNKAYVGAWTLGLFLGGLSIFGLVRYPHWVWAAPIVCALLALGANQRLRRATGQLEVIVLCTVTLAFLIGSGLLAVLASRVAR